MTDDMQVFDRGAVLRHRERAAPDFESHAFLLREVAERLADRLDDLRRTFPLALDLGAHDGGLGEVLGRRGGIETLIQVERAPAMAARAGARGRPTVIADEDALPFGGTPDGPRFDGPRFDLAMSVLSLHWVNDLPGCLLQIRQALKPDGLFLGAFFGGETLRELRAVLMEAELEVEGGAGPRVSPFVDLRDAGALLQRAGFALPVADLDSITVTYPDALALMRELRGMGETNAVRDRRKGLTRPATLLRAAALYEERFGDGDGRIPATFQVVFLTAWAPDASQQQPLRPGSAKTRLAEALGTEEVGTGEASGPTGEDR